MPTRVRASLEDYYARRDRDDSAPCLWLTDDGRCRHYDWRPDVCREFRPGVRDCNAMRERIGLVSLPLVSDDD